MPVAAIVGAGIGGLACALALGRLQNWQVHVFERAESLSELGAGLQLGPNAVRCLQRWGLLAPLRAVAFEPQGLCSRDWHSGERLSYLSLRQRIQSRWQGAYLQIHRADLQQVLYQSMTQMPNCQLHLGHAVSAVNSRSGELLAGAKRLQADLIIGADGIRSTVRQLLLPDTRTRYTGQTAWRLLIPTDTVPQGLIADDATIWMGPGKHLVHYYVRGGRWINCVGVVEQAHWSEESWTQPADFNTLARDFHDAHADVRQLIQAAAGQTPYRWALFDRAPMPHWHRDKVVLLGDACHATLPFVAQGAAMAIEDATVLADCLAANASLEQQLTRYTQRRRPRTDWIQRASKRNARIFHLRGAAARARNLALRSGLAKPVKLADRIYDFDALA